jgi:hypothetical protein
LKTTDAALESTDAADTAKSGCAADPASATDTCEAAAAKIAEIGYLRGGAEVKHLRVERTEGAAQAAAAEPTAAEATAEPAATEPAAAEPATTEAAALEAATTNAAALEATATDPATTEATALEAAADTALNLATADATLEGASTLELSAALELSAPLELSTLETLKTLETGATVEQLNYRGLAWHDRIIRIRGCPTGNSERAVGKEEGITWSKQCVCRSRVWKVVGQVRLLAIRRNTTNGPDHRKLAGFELSVCAVNTEHYQPNR